ncbi:MAG: hypothetical protein M3155_03575 [Actinomycetota bacterium]|nr:hypothetical protein [Actinomycetota bacterium]
MLNLSDAHHFRKTVAGACMILAPACFLASSIVAPSSDNNSAAILRATAAHQDRFYISTVLVVVGAVLLLPALLGLMHMLRERQVAWGHVGGALALVGNLMFMLYAGISLMQWQMVRGGARVDMVSLYHRFTHTTGTQVFLFFTLAFTIGLVVLGYGAYRARAIHWSTATALAAGAVVLQVAFFMGNTAAWFIVATGILLVAFASIGRMVLLETDEEWEHTPEYRGFRPAATH